LYHSLLMVGMAQKVLGAFLVSGLLLPGCKVADWFFHSVVVKVYGRYLTLCSRLGWQGLNRSPFAFLFNQKLVHFLVIFITLLLASINLSAKTRAESPAQKAGSTIIASLVESEFSGFQEDSQLIVETFDRDAVITQEQQKYLSNLGSFRPQPRATFKKEQETDKKGMLGKNGSSALSGDKLAGSDSPEKEEKVPEREETVTYTVQPGDTISTIAAKYGVSVRTILWENDLTAYSIIRPGDKLDILPVTGVSHKVARGESLSSIADQYDISVKKLKEQNKIADATSLQIGQEMIIPGGEKQSSEQQEDTTSQSSTRYTGINAIQEIVKPDDKKQVASNKMAWPTSGHRITQYYSWRHHGLDIADSWGTPIYTADAGTVEYVGWGRGYGNQIVINHGGGKKTRYAHLSKFYVKNGDSVKKGQSIAAMGSTGWSTGPHLHFEVIINSVKYNPLNYIK